MPVFNQNSDYEQIKSFCESYQKITYVQFDRAILKEVNLFSLPETFDFELLSQTLDKIIAALPAIKRIFANPITRITAEPEILPVESVRAINNQTVVHAAVHSELWENITAEGLKPRKLLSFDNRDNYAIYENLVFVRGIDTILAFVRKNIGFINDILYSNRELRFNLLERENHLSYFLALGKLHTGYVRDYSKYSVGATACMDKLLFIDSVLRARLGRPVYRLCKKVSKKLTLKKTNIFKGHKDYKKVYQLLKWFSEIGFSEEVSSEGVSDEDYGLYCSMLALFSSGHFNFEFSDELLSLKNLDASANFGDWRLNLKQIKTEDISALMITVEKDTRYRMILLPVTDSDLGKERLDRLKGLIEAEEYIVATPTAADNASTVFSIYDIDSFRRFQQLLFRGMVYSDRERRICPFCGEPLTVVKDQFECDSCRTVIAESFCEAENKHYFVTDIKNFSPKRVKEFEFSRRDRLSFDKQATAVMHFRNITPISADCEPICPYCRKNH